jgi:hypothetical protein
VFVCNVCVCVCVYVCVSSIYSDDGLEKFSIIYLINNYFPLCWRIASFSRCLCSAPHAAVSQHGVLHSFLLLMSTWSVGLDMVFLADGRVRLVQACLDMFPPG